MKPQLVVLSGAGISAESGIPTFRGSDGLWEGHRIEDVATPEAWIRNPETVLEFYNQRRRKAKEVEPNEGHKILARLEAEYNVTIVTQNVDNLHERAGSSNVLHLHGSLFEARSTVDPTLIYPINGTELNPGDFCSKGSQLRPNIVWFGEEVPLYPQAAKWAAKADFFIVVGTSLAVYPAAGLVNEVRFNVPIFLVDPNLPNLSGFPEIIAIQEKASVGLAEVAESLRKFR